MNTTTCPRCGHEFFPARPGWDVIGEARMTIPPEVAAKFQGTLSSFDAVKQYAAKMKDGTWDSHGSLLQIWRNGKMLMGFTRMAAVVEAGVPVEFDVQIIEESGTEFRDGALRSTVHQGKILSPEQVVAIVNGEL